MRDKLNIIGGALVVTAALGLGMSTASWAESHGSASGQTGQARFNDQQLQAYAVAAAAVQEIREKWVPRVRQADSTEEQAQIRQQAISEMTDAIEQQGLNVEEYNAITEAARQNAELRRQITDYMQQ